MVPLAALLIASALARAVVPETRQQIEKPLPAAVAKVFAAHRAGDVTVQTIVTGKEPLARLEISVSGADAKAERRFLDGVNLSVAEENGATVVRSLFPDKDAVPLKVNFNATLTLLLPESCALVVENSYGKVLVDGRVGDVKVTNYMGAVEVGRVRGGVAIDDSFNSITVHDVEGDLNVMAKNCPVTAERVGGLAKIRTSACAVRVDVAGAADVETSLVTVDLKTIARDARVVAAFCAVTATGVGGNLTVTAGNFPVHVADVGGDVSIQQKVAKVEVRRAKGKVTVTGSACDTLVEDAGSAELHCPYSLLHLARVGNLVVENTTRTLEIVDPLGDVQATASGGLLKLRATKLPADDAAHEITLVANGGAIELELPTDGSYALDATSTSGQLECTLPGMDVTQQGTARVGSLRRGDGKTKLHATCVGGAIRVVPAAPK